MLIIRTIRRTNLARATALLGAGVVLAWGCGTSPGSASPTAGPGETAGFRLIARIDVGKNPHQIAFTPDGRRAWIASTGSDRVTRVDTHSHRVLGTLDVACIPIGVALPSSGRELIVSCFGSDRILRFRLGEDQPIDHVVTGGSPSLLVGPHAGTTRYLVSAEKADRLWVLDAERFVLEHDYPTGSRPFPPSATSDGRLAFVPNYNDGTVTIVDLETHRVLETVKVGAKPSGGAVLPGDREYAVAVRGENRIALIHTASRKVVVTVTEGIGESPFSVVVSRSGRVAFVNNTASHDVSVLSLAERRVVARIPVGEMPIVMAVHPSGQTLWVSSEGSHEVSVIEIPRRWR